MRGNHERPGSDVPPMALNPTPCSSCPYRKDCPPGIWAKEEYQKLREFDGFPGRVATFLCHQSSATGILTLCRGWLSVHRDGIAVRVLLAKGEVTESQVYAEPKVELYASGNEAADAGERGIRQPGERAKRMAARLLEKKAAKRWG
jgi:hypothetical protein